MANREPMNSSKLRLAWKKERRITTRIDDSRCLPGYRLQTMRAKNSTPRICPLIWDVAAIQKNVPKVRIVTAALTVSSALKPPSPVSAFKEAEIGDL